MRTLFLLLTPLLCVYPALADIVMVQSVDTMGQKMTMTIKIKGDLTRVDVNPQVSMIIDAKTGDMTNIMHEQKMFMKMNVSSMQGMMAQMSQQAGVDTAAKPVIKDTGTKEKINGYDTEEYLMTKGQVVSHLWIAKNFPNYDAVVKATQVMQNGPMGKMMPQMQMNMADLPGMPVKTVVETNGQPTATVILQSVEQKDLDPAEFAPPADYKSFEMPAMPASMPSIPQMPDAGK